MEAASSFAYLKCYDNKEEEEEDNLSVLSDELNRSFESDDEDDDVDFMSLNQNSMQLQEDKSQEEGLKNILPPAPSQVPQMMGQQNVRESAPRRMFRREASSSPVRDEQEQEKKVILIGEPGSEFPVIIEDPNKNLMVCPEPGLSNPHPDDPNIMICPGAEPPPMIHENLDGNLQICPPGNPPPPNDPDIMICPEEMPYPEVIENPDANMQI